MLMVAPVAASQRIDTPVGTSSATGIELLNIPRSTVPAVTHVDYSARVQTVSPQRHDRYFRLIDAFHKLTGCPMLVNTSFNVRGEPIVHTPQEAYACFMRTDIDVLAIGSFYLLKHEQPQWDLSDNWRETIPLD
jgi:carbamoyltransferase